MVLFERRNREITDDCDLVVFGLLAGLGLEDDVVEPNRRTVRIRWHCESLCLHFLCCPLAEVFAARLPQVAIVADFCILLSLI